jgi:hypothetical protein
VAGCYPVVNHGNHRLALPSLHGLAFIGEAISLLTEAIRLRREIIGARIDAQNIRYPAAPANSSELRDGREGIKSDCSHTPMFSRISL